MVDFSHSVSQIHSQTPHTYNQSYPSHPLHHQFTSNSSERFSQPFVQFVPTKTTITPPIHQFVSLSHHNPLLGCGKLEKILNSRTPSLTEMRLEPNFIIDRSPKEKLKSAKVKVKFKVMSRIMKKRERRLGFSHQKQFQLSPILNSFLELSIHGDNSASGASLHKSNPSDADTNTIRRGYGCLHQHSELHAYESSTYTTSINNAEKTSDDCDSLTGSLNLETCFNDGLMKDEEVCFTTSLASTVIELDSKEPLNIKSEVVEPFWENASGKFKYVISDYSDKNLFVKIGCLHKDQYNKPSNEKSEFTALHLFDKRLQLEGLSSYGRIRDTMFGWLLESVLVPAGDKNSIDLFLEVFSSLPHIYQNWRAVLNWFRATVIQCSVDPYVFIDNILLGDISGKVSLHFDSMMERKTRNVEKMFDVIWQRWISQIIFGTLIIENFVKELHVEFSGNYMKLAWILLDIYHTSVFRNCLLLLTAPRKDIHVLQEFKGFHFYWVFEVIQSALVVYLNFQEFLSFYLLHQELIYGGHQVTECQLEIPSNVTCGITVRYKRLLQFLRQYLRLLALICGLYDETIEISFAEFSKTSEPGMVIHTRLTTRRYHTIVSLQLGYNLRKGLIFSCIVVVGKVSHMLIQLGSKKLDDNIGLTYWQKQVDHHGRDTIGNSRDQFNNANCGVKWMRVIH